MMDDAARNAIAEGLKKAIQAETDGYHFYRMTAANTEDPQGRVVFDGLAEEELEHRRYLEKQYDKFLADGTFDTSLKLTLHVDLSGDSPIFSNALRERAKAPQFEMSALSIAVQLELNAVRHYQEQARIATEPSVVAFYETLIEWEKNHYEGLSRQQETLREMNWADAGFSPF